MSAADHPFTRQSLTEPQKGVLLCLAAHLVWGGMATYFGLIRHISPAEIAVNRGLWSLPIAAALVWWLGQLNEVRRLLAQPRILATLAFTSFLIVFNWGFYVWSIQAGRTLESSLGYYINPLLNVVAGYLFLGERFTRIQILAIVLAVAAVVIQTIGAAVFPWLGLMLGASFCLYGFIRKTVDVGPVEGFFIEVLIIALPLAATEIWLASHGEARFLANRFDTLMRMGCGALTSASLMLFAAAIMRIRYSTAGLMQYISPSLVFLTAVFVFKEPMDRWKLLSFVLIWVALAIYTVSAIREDRVRKIAANEEPATF